MTLPNLLTILRLFIGPLFYFFYTAYPLIGLDSQIVPYILLSFLIIAEASDATDGYVARKYNMVTSFGKLLDPMSDSIYRISIFLTLTLEPIKIPIYWVFVLLYRDSLVATLRTALALKGFTLAARKSGKLKAGIQGAASLLIILLMIPYSYGHLKLSDLQQVSTLIVAATALFTVYSGIEYFIAHREDLKKIFSNAAERSP